MGAGDGTEVFPVWPAQEYGVLCAAGAREGYLPKAISLESVIRELIPSLKNAGTQLGVFPTPLGTATTPSVDQVQRDLTTEPGHLE